MKTLLRGMAALILLGTAVGSAVAQAPPSAGGQNALIKQFQTGGGQATTALNTVLHRPQVTPAVPLFLASATAMKNNRLEDGAFLFYVAQMRHRFDMDAFPPNATDGNGPRQLLQALSDTLGRSVNPTVMVQPAVFSRVVPRMAQWEPQIPGGYSPGWDYRKPARTAKARIAHAARKRLTLKGMTDLATLVSDPVYLQDFRLVQSYNLSPPQSRPSKTQYEAARARLTNLERKKGIKGPFTSTVSG